MGGQKGIAFFYRFFAPHVNLTCVTTKSNDADAVNGYEVLNIISNSKLRYINLFYFFTLRKIIRQKKITHLIIEHPYYGWLAVLLKWFCRVKLIVHSHNIEALRFKSTGKWWWGILWNYERFTHRMAEINFFIHDEDREYGIKKFGLKKEKCFTITYGFELSSPPAADERNEAKEIISAKYNIGAANKILLFNGTLDYKPNLDAVDIILNEINPALIETKDFSYKIIICGKNLPASYNGLKEYRDNNIIYAGFVDDITLYFKGADIFINPVTDGGGIKTKLVEALGYNMNVITTQSGAIGVPISITGDKMKVIKDNDWKAFVSLIISSNTSASIPKDFFEHFYWGNIAKKAASSLLQ